MYAIVEIAGKQYKITEGMTLNVDKLEAGTKEVVLDKVLLLVNGNDVKVGTPTAAGVSITAEVIGDDKGKKVVIFKWKRRKYYKRKAGHRHKYTKLKIKKIEVK